MKKAQFTLILAFVLVFSSTAFALPAVTPLEETENQIAVKESASGDPAAGVWVSYTDAINGDEDAVDKLRFDYAMAATDLGYINYDAMMPQEKAVAAYAMFGCDFSYEGAMLFSANDVSSSVIPVHANPSGDYALFVLEEGEWKAREIFSLESADTEAVGFSLTFEDLDGLPAIVAKLDGEEWKAAGMNNDLLQRIIKVAFWE